MLPVIILILLIILLVYYNKNARKRRAEYFTKKGIVPLQSRSIFTIIYTVLTQSLPEITDLMYKSQSTQRLFGFYDNTTPVFFLRDPLLIKQLAVKDFDYFLDHGTFTITREHDSLFGNMLLSLHGKTWKDMRSALSPAFTGSKMRLMFDLMAQCGHQFNKFFVDQYRKDGPQSYDMKEIYSKFTNDVIATCAFGVKCDSLRDPKNTFFEVGTNLIEIIRKPSMALKFFFIRRMPAVCRFLNIKMFDDRSKEIFSDIIKTTMITRKRENIVRHDMINLLMELQKGSLKTTQIEADKTESIAAAGDHHIQNSGSEHTWTNDELIAQCFTFYLAGFDTSSTLMAFTAYELAVNPDIQSKLLAEIDESRAEGKSLTYDILQGMKYLDMVIAESLRKWPPTVITDRLCVKNYAYENTDDGLKFTIEKGKIIWIPIFSLHRDPKYFPNPEVFDPERFSDENKGDIDFNAYLPFGVGPRNCIGSRFAIMQAKVVLYYLLVNFRLEVCDKTPVPIKLKKTLAGMIPEKFELMFKPRNN